MCVTLKVLLRVVGPTWEIVVAVVITQTNAGSLSLKNFAPEI